jgi:hypothetical protein
MKMASDKKKLPYEPPEIYELEVDMAQAMGKSACSNGNKIGASGKCNNGNKAGGGGCNHGNKAGFSCDQGNKAGYSCTKGNKVSR